MPPGSGLISRFHGPETSPGGDSSHECDYPAWFHFTRPDNPCHPIATGVDSHAVDELLRLIKATPDNGRIDGHIFNIKVTAVARALLDAQTRGVRVWISTDGQIAKDHKEQKDILDNLQHRVYCTSGNRRGCISTHPGSISHTKLFTFSATTMPDGTPANNAVWLGSANQTFASGMRLYNNTVTIYGDNTLFGEMRSYLGDLYGREETGDYFDAGSGRGRYLADSADVFASPEAQTDIVMNRLDDITPDDQCEIRVMQASLRDSRLNVVNKLVGLARKGCRVSIVAHNIEAAAKKALLDPTVPNLTVHENDIHDKSFIVHAKYGNARAFRVYTGSQNLGSGSAHRFDEIFVKLAAETGGTHPVYDAYVQHFKDANQSGTKLR
jgi:phosphatidylserine/phosphatidylglycerophosphate/cardiolipin synthase-like enzyme